LSAFSPNILEKKPFNKKKILRNYYSVQGKTRSPIRLFERITGCIIMLLMYMNSKSELPALDPIDGSREKRRKTKEEEEV
jgi:hypothetical protein